MVTELEQEQQLSGILTDIATRLNKMPLSQEQKQELYGRLVVNITNAGGVSMDGKTFYDPAAGSPKEVEDIAKALGTDATSHRNSVSVSPFAKPSLGSSGTVLYTDAKTHELKMLVVRRKKDSNYWTYPAGYMELLPDGDKMLAPRVDDKTRDVLEEKTVGNMAGEKTAAVSGATGVAVAQTALPKSADMRKALDTDYQRLLAEKGWEEANRQMKDGKHIREVLKNNGMDIPAGFDTTILENYHRELSEESGLNLANFPGARTLRVRTDVSLSYSSGGQRNYTASPHYVTDLGTLDAPPSVAPQAGDTVETAWVPVRNITREANGQYSVHTPDGKTDYLNPYTVPVIEESLHTWLSSKIADGSANRFSKPANVLAELSSWSGKEKLRNADGQAKASAANIMAEGLSENGRLPDLTGEQGVRRINDYLNVSNTFSAEPEKTTLVQKIHDLIQRKVDSVPQH